MTAPAGNQRVVDLEGCFNFRDLGGYRTVDGRCVRWQRLFRADGLHRLTEADLAHLAGLGLATVIDLRTEKELDEVGRIAWPAPDLAFHHLPMLDVLPDRTTYPAWVDAGYVADRYVAMLEKGRDAVAEALAILTDPTAYPAVFHCAAGKDRTGLLAAVVLGLLNVSDEDIVADYALSQHAMTRMLHGSGPSGPRHASRSTVGLRPSSPPSLRRCRCSWRAFANGTAPSPAMPTFWESPARSYISSTRCSTTSRAGPESRPRRFLPPILGRVDRLRTTYCGGAPVLVQSHTSRPGLYELCG